MLGTSVIETKRRWLYLRVGVRLLPFLLLCYLVAMIDRLNVGFAKLQFMNELHFSETAFGTAAGILYIGYILFEIPSNLMLNRFGIRLTLLRIMSAWGVFTILLAFARSETWFYILRFFVGVAEAGFFPGIVLYLTYWFPACYRGKVISLFAMGVPLSGLVAGPLSGWIMTHFAHAAGLSGWQYLFILKGLPAIVLGIAAYFYLDDRPASASFLNEAEKAKIASDLAQDVQTSPPGTLDTLGGVFRSPRLYLLALVYFAFYSMQSILLIWVPTILKSAGVASLVEIGWRAGAISLGGISGMVIIGLSSDYFTEWRRHAVACGCVAAAALILLPLGASSSAITTALLAVAAACTFGFLGIFWTIPGAFLDKKAAAGGIALISSIGASGSAISPVFIGWMRDQTGSLQAAINVLALLMMAAMVLLFVCVPAQRSAAIVRARRPVLS